MRADLSKVGPNSGSLYFPKGYSSNVKENVPKFLLKDPRFKNTAVMIMVTEANREATDSGLEYVYGGGRWVMWEYSDWKLRFMLNLFLGARVPLTAKIKAMDVFKRHFTSLV